MCDETEIRLALVEAWWKQLELKSKGAGGNLSQQDRQRHQSLRDAESKLQTHSDSVEKLQQVLKMLKERAQLLHDYFTWADSESDDCKETTPVPERFQALQDTGLIEQGKRAQANLQDEIKAQKQALSLAVIKVSRAKEEFHSIYQTLEEERVKASQRDMDCPMCRHAISYSKLAPVLNKILKTLDKDSVAPPGWGTDDVKPHESYLSLLCEEEKRRLEQARVQRQLSLESQQLNSRKIQEAEEAMQSAAAPQVPVPAALAQQSASPETVAPSTGTIYSGGPKPNKSNRRRRKKVSSVSDTS